MSEVVVHECPDGQRFRINKIQEIRERPLVKGVSYAFQIDSDVEEGAAAAERGAPSPGRPMGTGTAAARSRCATGIPAC